MGHYRGEIVQACLHAEHELTALNGTRRGGVDRGLVALADLADTEVKLVTLVEHDEDVLVEFLPSGGVLELLINRHLAQEHVAAAGSPQEAFEADEFVAGNHTSHVAGAGLVSDRAAPVLPKLASTVDIKEYVVLPWLHIATRRKRSLSLVEELTTFVEDRPKL